MIKSHGYALLLDSRSNQIIASPYILETRHGKPGRSFNQKSPAVRPHRNESNINTYRGYLRESFFGGVFITFSYIKAR